MRRFLTPALLAALLFGATACKKTATETPPDEIPDAVLRRIKAHGFNHRNVAKVADGYLVEGDIVLTEEYLAAATPQTPLLIIAKEEQYHTFNLVNEQRYPTISVRLNNSSAQHQNAFSAALDESIARYNAENLTIRFQRTTANKADITVESYYQVSNTLGSAGFPSGRGAPYSKIQMNTYWYGTGTDATNVNYIATVMAHEIGHCIGMRHTDYMNRAYSCGSGGNEGQTTSGVGAVHIPGTPTGPDAGSWMLACIGDRQNRTFNTNDKVALNYLY